MFPLTSRRLTFSLLAAIAGIAGSCREPASVASGPPPAEFLVTAGDSAFWVSSSEGRFRVRRAPLSVANVGGRFYELYVTDDDRSYFDALLIGQRVYRRDLVSGDSVQVFEDKRVARIATAYASAHANEHALGADEEGSDDPHTVATSETELLDVVGPLLSYAHHTDIEIANSEDSHVVRHGVIDLRDGSTASLRQVFGDTVASRIVAQGRSAFHIVIDSVRRASGARGRRAARAIDSFRFDSTSFTIDEIDGSPMVGFYVPGEGETGGGLALPLPHVRAPEPEWWRGIAPTLPRLGADSSSEIWKGARYDVVAQYDSSGEFAVLVVLDSAKHQWSAARLPTPARRVYRLDTPDVDSTARQALARAFDESMLYSGAARTVLGPRRARPRVVLVSGAPRQASFTRADSRPTRRHRDRH
ncbi:MAG TPA: hypothetical protein VM076_21570 [Gemmatimonadaceae bacterium]|nr:hypothetical protein [Gemmatimonadaceae bacterium]